MVGKILRYQQWQSDQSQKLRHAVASNTRVVLYPVDGRFKNLFLGMYVQLVLLNDVNDFLSRQTKKLVTPRHVNEMFLDVTIARVRQTDAHELLTERAHSENILRMQSVTKELTACVLDDLHVQEACAD